MFIKSLVINGFKSYRNETVVGPFDEGFNVVVGRNGAGKSNFFSAIEFVLSEAYTNLKPEERIALLTTNSSGQRLINAFVEIAFDNTSRRFPLDMDEVKLRRTIGSKKDQYHLNGKIVQSRKELKGMLEAAGMISKFSFVIVKQGQIMNLATCSDKHRLDMLKDMAGTKVYTEKREASMRELESTNKTMGEIEANLEMFSTKLQELEEQKRDLLAFKKLESKKNALSYLICSQELFDVKAKESKAEADYRDLIENSKKANLKLRETKEELTNYKEELEKKKRQHDSVVREINDSRLQLEKNMRSEASLKMKLKDLEEEEQSQSRRDDSEGFEDLRAKNEAKKGEKMRVEESIKAKVAELEEQKQRLEILEQEKKRILEVSGRAEMFDSVEERDDWIQAQIKDKTNDIDSIKLQLVELRKSHQQLQSQLDQSESRMELLSRDASQHEEEFKSLKSQHQEMIKKKSQVSADVDTKYKAVESIQSERRELEDKERTAVMNMKMMKGFKEIYVGAENLKRLLDSRPELEEGYHGLLCEQFDCDDSLKVAVDQVAGNRLFYHVVDSPQVANRILRAFNAAKFTGSLSFMAKSKLQAKTFPRNLDLNLKQTIPLMEKLQFEQESRDLLSYVFGRTLVCRNLEVACKVARKTGLDCVTLDGDKGSSKGVLSGGYLDRKKNKMILYENFMNAKSKLEEERDNEDQLVEELAELHQELRQVNKMIHQNQAKLIVDEKNLHGIKSSLKYTSRQRNELFSQCIESRKLCSAAETRLTILERDCDGLRREMGEDLHSQMTEENKSRFDNTVKQLQKLRPNYKKKVSELRYLEEHVKDIDAEIEILSKDLRLLSDRETKNSDRLSLMDQLRQELVLCSKKVVDLTEGLNSCENQEVDISEDIDKLKKAVEGKERLLSNIIETVKVETQKQEEVLCKKSKYQAQVKRFKDELKEFPGVNPQTVESHQNDSKARLKLLLKKVHTDLKKYEHVNKKAVEQWERAKDKEQLHQRLEDLKKDRESVIRLIKSLDEKRTEMVDYTFRQVVKHFSLVFSRVVPGGSGDLQFCYPETGEDDISSNDEMTPVEKTLSATALKITVSFTGKFYF